MTISSHPDIVPFVDLVTPHRELDWDGVFGRADLIVDTRDASRGRSTRPGQVLRLGAGWS